jgi:NAD(P)H-dependent FMN reductase
MSASPIRLVGLSGSLRAQSYNLAALRAIASLLPEIDRLASTSSSPLQFVNAHTIQTSSHRRAPLPQLPQAGAFDKCPHAPTLPTRCAPSC